MSALPADLPLSDPPPREPLCALNEECRQEGGAHDPFAAPSHGPLGVTPRHRPDRRPPERDRILRVAEAFGHDLTACLD